jgi:hypothetical protein
MKIKGIFTRVVSLVTVVLLAASGMAYAQDDQPKALPQEQLDQLLAPIALYPDSLLTQILMASTYPLEVVKAMNWLKQNKGLKGDALTAALEKQKWDPSVKSLVNFPDVLQMMNDKLDWTQQLGDAFLAQQQDVMKSVQKLRGKAHAEGNLKTTKEQKVVVEKETQTIIIEPANPQVVYVPTYNPTVVYGVWPYPAYPPYYAYPPGYAAGAAAFGFASGVAVGAAWGYAWGHSNWNGGNVDIDVNRNANINNNIDRSKYQGKGQVDQSGKGKWNHDPSHRQGVAYRDSSTAQKFGQQTGRSAGARGGDSRGYGSRGGADKPGGGRDISGRGDPSRGGGSGHGGRESAFSGGGNGSFERSASERGKMSRGGSSSGRSSRSGGGFGGGGFGGGGRGGRGRR